MIGYLKGKIINIFDNSVVIGDSVGFLVNTSTLGLNLNDEVELFTHMVVRENDISLWGFQIEKELEIFKLLINVSGVGPRTAQTLIYNIGVGNIISAIMNNHSEVLKTTGVGLKTAQKIVLDLKGKIKYDDYLEMKMDITNDENSLINDVISAMQTLGYRESDLLPIVKKVINETQLSTPEEVIKKVLISM